MKKTILPISVIVLSTLNALAQGTVNFSTSVLPDLLAHIYGLEVPPRGPDEFLRLSGNTATETPAGTQTYTGALLTGSGFSAQLFAANGIGKPEGSLVAVPGSITSFRTGSVAGTFTRQTPLVIPNVPVGGTGTFQIRAWDNVGGTIVSWDFATVARGKSDLFTVSGLGDGVVTPPANMLNLRSFCFGNTDPTPEPSTYALLGLGALGLWFFRRKQPAA
jgi:hypothetical protein